MNGKIIVGVLEIRTRDCRMVSTDESTELRRPPIARCVWHRILKRTKISKDRSIFKSWKIRWNLDSNVVKAWVKFNPFLENKTTEPRRDKYFDIFWSQIFWCLIEVAWPTDRLRRTATTNSVTRWPEYLSCFCYLQQFKFIDKFQRSSKFCKILNIPS